jgi:hypothetical protein
LHSRVKLVALTGLSDTCLVGWCLCLDFFRGVLEPRRDYRRQNPDGNVDPVVHLGLPSTQGNLPLLQLQLIE